MSALTEFAAGSSGASESRNGVTLSCCLVPILLAFRSLEELLGNDTKYTPANPEQARLLASEYWGERSSLASKFKTAELRGLASRSIAELNRLLEQAGYPIRLAQGQGNDFGAVAFQDVSVQWQQLGTARPIHLGGIEYHGFVLKGDAVKIGRSDRHPKPIAVITTANGDTVSMTRVNQVLNTWQLLDLYTTLSESKLGKDDSSYEGVHVPKVCLDQEVDLSWLEGLALQGSEDGGRVSQAKQFTRLRMNEFGARAASGFAVAVMRSMPSYLTMDGPFVLIMERPGVKTPTFLGVIDTDSFKDPGQLSR
jgi:hypothetical protein